ncbi:PilZ domain-containing protein [Bdellovibrionota bacterium FG-2]
MLPIYVKGTLEFTFEGHFYTYDKQNLSAYGVGGLPWGSLDPARHFAKKLKVTVKLETPEPMTFTTEAQIIREATQVSEHMGLKFSLIPEQAKKVNALIAKYGFFPTEYIRKYPRIPSLSVIQTFPLRVQGTTLVTATQANPKVRAVDHIFDVGNLSPNGILLSTESLPAQTLLPGHRLLLRMEPRGWFPVAVEMEGMICRVVDDINSRNGNTIRYIGIKFTKIDEMNKTIFLDLLKDILERLKTISPEVKNERRKG